MAASEQPIDIQSLQLLQFSLEQSSIATFWVGADARILHVNQAACRGLGYACEELLRLQVFDINPDYSPERWAADWEDLKTNGRRVLVTRNRRRDGSIFPVEVTAKYLEYQGQGLSFACVQDISERVRAEEERRRLQQHLLQTQKLESLAVMAGGIAHDFNNLLTVILGNALFAQGQLPADAPAGTHLGDIVTAGKNAAELCQQLLAFTGKTNLLLSPATVNSLIEGWEDSLSAPLPAGTRILKTLAETEIPELRADVVQLHRVVAQLISNAAEAYGPDGGVVTVSAGTAHAERAMLDQTWLGISVPSGPCAFIEVADAGAGMDPASMGKMFEPYFSTKFVGRGLGLAFVFGIMRSHHGAIHVTSNPGQGTKVRLLFPLACDTPALATSPPGASPASAEHPRTILVVEDEPAVRDLVRRVLIDAGYRVLTAVDGLEALQVFRQDPEAIDLVLLDLTMPRMDGETTFHELRKLEATLKIILCTGFDAQHATNRLLLQDVAGVLQKPFTPTQLLDLTQMHLGARPSADHPES